MLGVLIYVLLLSYSLLDDESWKWIRSKFGRHDRANKIEQDSVSHFPDEHSDELLHTDINTGLSINEVRTRQAVHGPNEIRRSRNWISSLMRLSVKRTNLLLEVSAS